jgi:hypothetical protein
MAYVLHPGIRVSRVERMIRKAAALAGAAAAGVVGFT